MKNARTGKPRVPGDHRPEAPGATRAKVPADEPVTTPGARTTAQSDTSAHPLDTRPLPVAPAHAGDGLGNIPMRAGLPVAPVDLSPEEAVRSSHARRRALLMAGIAVLLLVLIIEMALLSPWADTAASEPPRAVPPVPMADVNPFGVNVFLHKEVDPWKREKTLDMARDMGAGWIKQQFPWAEIEFSKNNFFDAKNNQGSWDKFDNIVELAAQRGLRIIARIDSTPEWARYDDEMPEAVRDDLRSKAKAPPSPGHVHDFGDFIRTFVARYKGRIPAIQIWNEPNLRDEWATGVNAKDYTSLLAAAYIAAKSVDPNMIVMAAPLAPNNEALSQRGNLSELDYLQAMYYAGAEQYFDVMAANAYGKTYEPEDPPSPDRLNFRRVELLRKVMEDNNDADKPIWFNEYGWNASPADMDPSNLVWGRVTPEQQADYTVRGIEYARAHWPWAGVFTVWYLRQVGDIPQTASEYYFSLVNPEFVPGPTYKALREAAGKMRSTALPGTWGPLSAPVRLGSGWQVQLSTAVPGGFYVVPSASRLEDADALSLAFQGTDVYLGLVPPASASGTSTATAGVPARYYITVDGSSSEVAAALPRDAKGRAYIDVPSLGQVTRVQVAKGLGAELPTTRHTLTVSVLPTEDQGKRGSGFLAAPVTQNRAVNLPGIAATGIEAHRSYLLFSAMTLLLVAGIILELVALRRMRCPPEVEGAHGQ